MWSPDLQHLKELETKVLKKVLSPPSSRLLSARYQAGIYTLTLFFRAANTREVAKQISSRLIPTETGCAGLHFTSSKLWLT